MVARVDQNFILNLRALVGDTKCIGGEGTSPDLHLPRAAGTFVSGGVGESDVITRNLLVLWNCMVTDGGIMVSGGIWHNGRTDLVIIDDNLTGLRYRDEILVNTCYHTLLWLEMLPARGRQRKTASSSSSLMRTLMKMELSA